jgi:hypothetical protein
MDSNRVWIFSIIKSSLYHLVCYEEPPFAPLSLFTMDEHVDYPNELLDTTITDIDTFVAHARQIERSRHTHAQDRDLNFIRLVLAGRLKLPNTPQLRVSLKPLQPLRHEEMYCERSYGDMIGYGLSMPFKIDMNVLCIPAINEPIPCDTLSLVVNIHNAVRWWS